MTEQSVLTRIGSIPQLTVMNFAISKLFLYILMELESKILIYSISPYSFLTKTSIVTSVCGLVKIVTDFPKKYIENFLDKI